jgi:hypothetical protein
LRGIEQAVCDRVGNGQQDVVVLASDQQTMREPPPLDGAFDHRDGGGAGQ